MLGVVLWSDQSEGKAVIWCEDHGQLAYCGQTARTAVKPEVFGEGDLIQFDLTEHQNMRLAHNPRRIEQQYCNNLGRAVSAAGAESGAAGPERPAAASGGARPIDLGRARERLRASPCESDQALEVSL